MKKRILFIIAFIIIITTTIRTLIIGYSFLDYTEKSIKNQIKTFKTILEKSNNKKEILKLIKESDSKIINLKIVKTKKNLAKTIKGNNIQILISKHQIKAIAPLNNKSLLKITFSADIYYQKLIFTLIKLIVVAIIFLIIIIVTVNHFLTPYLELLEKIKKVTNNILQGNFNTKIDTKLNGDVKNFVESFNGFIDDLEENFEIIQKKYFSLIDTEIQSSDKLKKDNPLKEAKETIENLADIFKFKKLIEEDESMQDVFRRIENILKQNNINNYVLLGIDNLSKKIIFQKTLGISSCCDVVKNFRHCRTYRTKKVIDSIQTPEICIQHRCKQYEYICIPFTKNNNFSGILKINIDKEHIESIEKIFPFLKIYLDEASSILEAKYTLELLHIQTVKDPLTELFNRKYLKEILSDILAKADITKEKVGFLMLDMDNFKSINDTYGHKIGDLALKIISDVIKNSIRKSDIAIRYGGEEFLIILLDVKNKKNLKKIAEKIRITMKKIKININNENTIHRTISIGGSLYPNDSKDGWECITKADDMLYKAKNSGKNKTVIYLEKKENDK